MFEFNIAAFAKRLSELPANRIMPEQAERNAYLQEHVFDELLQGRAVELTKLDFDAFTLQDVTPDAYRTLLAENQSDWAKCFNKFVKKTPVAVLDEPAFF